MTLRLICTCEGYNFILKSAEIRSYSPLAYIKVRVSMQGSQNSEKSAMHLDSTKD